ncbi:hypothetical protein AAC387_Pa11g2060 [Persea americana]
MASLEDLLAEEGFKGRRMKSMPRNSFGYKTVSMPTNRYRDQISEMSSPDVRIRTERTRSDVSKPGSRSSIRKQKSERVMDRRSRSNLIEIERLTVESKDDAPQIESVGEIDSYGIREDEKHTVGSYESLRAVSKYRVRNNTEFQENLGFDDRNWNDVQKIKRFSNSVSGELVERETLKDTYELQENGSYKATESLEDEKYEVGSAKNISEKMSFSSKSQNKRSQSYKVASDSQNRRQRNLEQAVSEPALDEIAVQAMISILSGYVRRFIKDENFRASLHHSCMSCLSLPDAEELDLAENALLVNFEEAIKSIEIVAEELGSPKELKKASLQLSVIAGLNSKDLRDGFTSGVPNSLLAACAHLYLSVIYKLHKKDKVAAKHVLQVFCDAPSQARKSLLPELWDQLFLPHLSHLKMWYDQEADAIPNTSSRLRKLKLLEKVYNEILDSATYQFAVYYKEWLTAGIEAPAVPSILVPTASVCEISQKDSHGPLPEQGPSPADSVSSLPIISKTLYEAVSGRANKSDGSDEVNDAGEENFTACSRRILDGTIEDDRKDSYFLEPGTFEGQRIQEGPVTNSVIAPLPAGLLLEPVNSLESHQIANEEVKELKEVDTTHCCQNISGSTAMLNVLTLKKLATSVFLSQEAGDSPDSIADAPKSNLRSCIKCEFMKTGLASNALNTHLPVISSSAGQFANYRYFEESSFLSSTPKDFVCPLTGQLFEDPVTLETGQTFEREAIKKWFAQGNTTCPVTGKTLGSVAVPITNFILKRVIEGWKSVHCRNLLAFASQMAGTSFNNEFKSKDEAAISILEQLLTGFDREERMENAKHLISLGGLQFLVRRFELGDLEEKTCVAALLSCCILADGVCRNYIAKNINKPSFIELLHSKQVNSRTNAVLLLMELICLNRRTQITSFLSALQNGGIMNTLHVLLVYLQTSPYEQRALVAVLLLHFDLMAEPRKYSIYREEAVDAIIVALERSVMDEKVREQSCRALLILGGHFSYCGEVKTLAWLLKQAGFCDSSEANLFDKDDEDMPWEEEDKAREEWRMNLTVLLLGNGKKSFLECISKCLGSGNSDLVRACLTTVAWLSQALASTTDAEFQLSAFAFLIPSLKQNLENEQIENRVLASLCLLNFSRISECQVLLMTFAEEIMAPLRSLAGVTWTAEQLCSVISINTL